MHTPPLLHSRKIKIKSSSGLNKEKHKAVFRNADRSASTLTEARKPPPGRKTKRCVVSIPRARTSDGNTKKRQHNDGRSKHLAMLPARKYMASWRDHLGKTWASTHRSPPAPCISPLQKREPPRVWVHLVPLRKSPHVVLHTHVRCRQTTGSGLSVFVGREHLL